PGAGVPVSKPVIKISVFLESLLNKIDDYNDLISSHLPRWLQVLLTEKFFNACVIHEEAKKNEKNVYCLDCCISICPHCLSPHSSHRLLQIRRYVYHDVIRLDDATKLMDCASVQVIIHNKQCKSDIYKPKATDKAVQRLRQL
ncbi:hypothetical protein Gorai_021375, partial [Gossypium raimondii]|nr:hypothetical protein [Gossypium raimondii]